MANALRLALLDDHDVMREALALLLQRWPRCESVLQAAHGLDYERRSAETGHIHIAIVDLFMPVRDGFETIRWIVRNQPRTLPIAISQDPHIDTVRRAVQAGARGFIPKTATPAEFFRALDHVHATGFHFNTHVSKALRREWEQETDMRNPDLVADSLSTREREFLLLYAREPFPQRAEIAVRMGLKENSVEDLRKHVVRKTGCHTKPELIAFVRKVGWA